MFILWNTTHRKCTFLLDWHRKPKPLLITSTVGKRKKWEENIILLRLLWPAINRWVVLNLQFKLWLGNIKSRFLAMCFSAYSFFKLPSAPMCQMSFFRNDGGGARAMQIFGLLVVYFDQRLGAAHPKCWLKYAFLTFLTFSTIKSFKKGKKQEICSKI